MHFIKTISTRFFVRKKFNTGCLIHSSDHKDGNHRKHIFYENLYPYANLEYKNFSLSFKKDKIFNSEFSIP